MIDRPDLADENLTIDIPTWTVNIPRIFEAVAEWAVDKTVAEIVELGQLLRVAVTPVLDGAGVLVDEQLEARDWWEREGDIAYPGQPYKFSATPAARRGPAPSIGQQSGPPPDTEAAGSGLAPATGGDPGSPPLEGLRIIEVTTNWAGPVAGRFLADLGSDNVKVEWATRPATRALFWVGADAGHAAPAPPPRHVLLRDEPQQARRVHRPRQAGRPRRVPRTGEDRRRGPREQQRPGHAQPRPRLRRPPGREPVDHHGVDVGLRRRRPAPRLGGLRRQHRDDELAHVAHGLSGRPALPHDAVLRRSGVGQLRRGRDHGGAAPPRPHRRGPVDRHVAERVRRDVLRRGAHRPPTHRRAACPQRQPRPVGGAAGRVPLHRHRQLGGDHGAVGRRVEAGRRPDRTARSGRGRVAVRALGPSGPPRRARRRHLGVDRRPRAVRDRRCASGARGAGRTGAGQLADPP